MLSHMRDDLSMTSSDAESEEAAKPKEDAKDWLPLLGDSRRLPARRAAATRARRAEEQTRVGQQKEDVQDCLDTAQRALVALAEVRASEADLTQRLAQMEAVAALGPEPGGA